MENVCFSSMPEDIFTVTVIGGCPVFNSVKFFDKYSEAVKVYNELYNEGNFDSLTLTLQRILEKAVKNGNDDE